MAKLGTVAQERFSENESPEHLLSAIEAFLSTCQRPAALEWGEKPIPLLAGQYALEIRSGRLSIEIWSENRSLSRRLLQIERHSVGILDCTVQRFGGKPGRLSFLDLARPQTAHRSLTGNRRNFAEQFRNMLTRQFPGWHIASLSVAQDLRRSFSRIYPRARLVRGNRILAALACADSTDEPQFLTFALIWHHHLAATAEPGQDVTLALFLPEGAGNMTAHRMRWMNKQLLQASLYLFNGHGSAGEVDPQDLGNLDTRVTSRFAANGEVYTASAIAAADGGPERWLESMVRASITIVEAELLTHPVHSQVLTFAAGDRDLIDLLAISSSGRLCVLELKASEDLHLPVQALDYWMRIAWHAQRGELNHLFPGVAVQPQPPKLILLAPAIAFHSSNANTISYFSRQIEVERVGISSDWRNQLRVILRLQGAAVPASQIVIESRSCPPLKPHQTM